METPQLRWWHVPERRALRLKLAWADGFYAQVDVDEPSRYARHDPAHWLAPTWAAVREAVGESYRLARALPARAFDPDGEIAQRLASISGAPWGELLRALAPAPVRERVVPERERAYRAARTTGAWPDLPDDAMPRVRDYDAEAAREIDAFLPPPT